MPFKKGDKRPAKAGRAKGSKNQKTILKEAIGLSGWERLQEYILTEGADKMTKEMNKMSGGSFGFAFREMAEYFKPKLARTEITGKDGEELKVNITLNLGK